MTAFVRPRFTYRAECGACGYRRAWLTATSYCSDGTESESVSPSSPGGELDAPCPACGTTEDVHVRRCWHGPHEHRTSTENDGSGRAVWSYAGVGQPGQGWRVPMPDGAWPDPVQLPDITHPDPARGRDTPDPYAGALPQVGGQMALA